MRKALFFIVLLLLLVSLQTSMIAPLGLPRFVNIPLVIIIFFTVMSQNPWMSWYAAAAGFFLDLFSPYPFGFHLILLPFVVLFVRGLFLQFFTNRSIYAMIVLMLAASIAYEVLWFFTIKLFNFFQLSSLTTQLSQEALWRTGFNTVFIAIIFYIAILVQRLARRFFLLRF